MYRILADEGTSTERRWQRRHVKQVKPRLCATPQNQVLTWDIAELRVPQKGEFYYCNTVMDVFSRYVVGWMLGRREREEVAGQRIAETAT